LAPNDPVFITRKIEAVPFPSAPNVVVSYPHREDWWNRYPAVRKSYSGNRSYDEFEWPYQDSKRIYQDRVLKRLRHLQHSATGRAVLAELRARPSYSVCIFPWDFLPSIDRDDPSDLGVTETLRIPQTRRERARGIKPRGTKFLVRGVSYASMYKPGAVDVFYSDYRCKESEADGVLLHELVHAMRTISGVFRYSLMGGGYGNNEEFYANTIQMIYHSEKGLPVFDYQYRPLDAVSLFEQPLARVLLTDLRGTQPSLFDALARVNADFNPIQQIDYQRRKLQGN
jgi:hypothetical protein